MTTGLYWDERCFWFSGGNYAFTQPVGRLVQPLAADGNPESPETKRRLKNLIDVTGLTQSLACHSAEEASTEALLRIHPQRYLSAFKEASKGSGGELGFCAGAFWPWRLSAGGSVNGIGLPGGFRCHGWWGAQCIRPVTPTGPPLLT